ncbi:MAG: response regulator [Oscillospiraceae bacterium]|nr:response regulator [Oscillospiraceae bacterium]
MRMWVPYLDDIEDDNEIEDFLESTRKEVEYTNFYFISREGDYQTIGGARGFLDLKDKLPKLIVDKEDIVIMSVVPNKPEIMVFAIPCEKGTYKGFEYEAIAITFNNEDLVKTLEITSFDGKMSSYLVHPDGRVIVENSAENMPSVYNFIGMLIDKSELASSQIEEIKYDFKNGIKGAQQIKIDDIMYYLVYEPTNVEQWMILGLVPTSVVNASMEDLQANSVKLVASGFTAVWLIFVIFLIWRYRINLQNKDTEIQYREELFDNLSNNVDDIFIMLNSKNYEVNYISPNIERLVGISEKEAKNNIRVLDNLVRDSDTVLIFDRLDDIQPGEQIVVQREYVHRKTNEIMWFKITVICRMISNVKKYILVMSDRTKEKITNQKLEDAVNAARNANRAKSTFLSNMSHDIRTPMNAIIGFTTIAIANITDAEKVKGYLSKILSSSNHLLSLINDVLDMSRIESGKIRLEEQEVNLADIFHDIKTIINGQMYAKQLELYMDIMDVSNEDVYCDKTRLNQVLLNLLSNAIKFTPAGGIVSVKVEQKESETPGTAKYIIRVKDNGIGMSKEFAEHIFEPFERERTSTVSRIQGTGLGMAISKNIVDMMGGTIEVNTEPGKGSEFTVCLTLRLRSEQKIVEKIKELENLRALVVDDNFDTCDNMTKMLAKVGMRSEWTLSGKEAILRAKQAIELNDSFHVYIIDWKLPDLNGIEVTRQIRALGENAPIIILTAYDWSDIEAEAKEAGVTAFCSKPIFMSDLRNTLLSSIGQNITENTSESNDADYAIFRGKRILLVEDNELNREIACEILSKFNLLVEEAENGAQALEKVAQSAPGYYDLVLMDIQMPIMNGYDATKSIRELDNASISSIPILAMTANAFDQDRKEAELCGMNGFLTKPISIDDLMKALNNLFSISSK